MQSLKGALLALGFRAISLCGASAQQAAQSRAALNKQILDEEMDCMRKSAQLATIVETENSLDGFDMRQ